MGIEVKVLADSRAPCGARLTTMSWKYPRSIHAEVLTHGMLARNSASSRAIPTEKLIQSVLDDPFVPEYIGANQKGMQAGEELSGENRIAAEWQWLAARDQAVETARRMLALGVHKQVVNRVIEPWMWITIIVSATEWDNVWGLRCHPAAEPHFQKLAYMARDAMAASMPKYLEPGQWHMPLIDLDEDDKHAIDDHLTRGGFAGSMDVFFKQREALACKISVGRCARVSYLTHDGRRDPAEDVGLHDRLVGGNPLHASPAEHVAQAMDYPDWFRKRYKAGTQMPTLTELRERVLSSRTGDPSLQQIEEEAVLAQMRSGKFYGFQQYRKTLANEHIGGRMP